MFAEMGYDRASLREICSAADANVASVSYYFGDKLGLYRSVIDHIRSTRIDRFPAPEFDADVCPEMALTLIVHTMLKRMLTPGDSGWEFSLILRELNAPTVVFQEVVHDYFRPVFETLQQIFRRLVGPSAPDYVLQQLALSVVGQCLYYRVGCGVVDMLIPESQREAHFQIESLCQHITSVVLSAAKNTSFDEQKESVAKTLAAPPTHHESNHTQNIDDQSIPRKESQ